MMKQRTIVSLILVLCILLSNLPTASAAGASGKWGKNIEWTFDQNTGKLVISGSGDMQYDSFAPDWTAYHLSIRSAEIKNGITSISPDCFYDCENMVEVSIPNTVKEIGTFAFANCYSLKSIKLPSGLTSIGSYAFDGCKALTSIDIPKGVAALSRLMFRDCGSLRQVTLHPGLITIGAYALCGPPITSIDLPYTVKTIDEYAFYGSRISQITLPNGLESIGSRAFCGCSFLKTITIPANVRTVSDDAFLSTELDSMIVLGSGTSFGIPGDSTYSVFGDKEAIVYGLPGSRVERFLAEDPNCIYTFKPMYFDDVAPGKWYFDSVLFAKENGLFNGVGNRAFAPERPMTRAMIVQVLYNLAGNGEVCDNRFNDVPDDAWYARAVAWAAENGIVDGMSPGVFAPDNNVTREQIACIVYRFTQLLGIDVDCDNNLNRFPDAGKVGNWAKDAIAWAVDRGIIAGSKVGNTDYLLPKANATRAQVAAIMMRCVLHWDDSLHTSLKIGVDRIALIPYVQQVAEKYMSEHEDVRIEVCESEVMSYDETPVYMFGEDAIVLIGGKDGKRFQKTGTTVVPLFTTPYVFATTKNRAETIRNVSDMVEMLKNGSISISICPKNTAEGMYASKLLSDHGIDQLTGELFDYEDNYGVSVFNVRSGISACAAVTEYMAKIESLSILEDSKYDGLEETFYAVFPEDTGKETLLIDFLDYLKTEGDVFTSCGLYPIES